MDFPDGFYKKLLDNIAEGVYFVDRDRRITYWNRGAERLTAYSAEEVLGRPCAENILVHTDCDGRGLCPSETCPAAIAMRSGQAQEARVFLRHKNGHRVPIQVRVEPILDQAGHVVGAVETFHDESAAVAAAEHAAALEKEALLDHVTGVGNRRLCELELEHSFNEWTRRGSEFAVVFIDIDHFKAINDAHGHEVGDRVLRMVAQTLANTVRSFDVVGRWGGEEFVVQLKRVRQHEITEIAERMRQLVQGSGLPEPQGYLQATISAGATMVLAGDTPDVIVRRADALMYRSKERGRNRVSVG